MHPPDTRTLPLTALAALATTAFLVVLTEALPAGVLPAMSADLAVTESAVGQTVTVYAIGTVVAAIPLSAATAGWRRKPLLLAGVAGFAVANVVTAVSPYYPLTMGARFVGGMAAGLVWALLAGYARRLAPVERQGRAIAIVMAGIPVGLALGVPAGTFLGAALGWRTTFALMTGLAVVLVGWMVASLPDLAGPGRAGLPPIGRTLRVPGVAPILFVTLVLILAHTVLYTYVAPYLQVIGRAGDVGLVLSLFGIASVVSIGVVGAQIDRRLRLLMIASTVLVAGAVGALAVLPALALVAVTAWGLGYGGVPTLLQTAVGEAGGEDADTAQAMLVTLWNVAMAGGGIVGGMLLDGPGPTALPWFVLVLLAPVLGIVVGARAHGFPRRP